MFGLYGGCSITLYRPRYHRLMVPYYVSDLIFICSLHIPWTLGEKNEETVVNAFETCCWRQMLKVKWTERITKDEVFQRAKEQRLLLKI